MAMTKRNFAVKLLFWLLPWPISRALPRSLRIYYFGPFGGPPPGFYDYWGVPLNLWPDAPPFDEFIEDPPADPPPWWPPDIPPYDEFIENPPDEQPPWWPPDAPPYDDFIENPPDEPPPWWPPPIPPYDHFIDNPPDEPPPWWPIDPYNPPPPDQIPDLPEGPVNPGDPFVPGPGPVVPPLGPTNFTSYFDNTHWTPKANGADRAVWNAGNKCWDSVLIGGIQEIELLPMGAWYINRRFSVIRFIFTVHDTVDFYMIDSAERLMHRQLGAKVNLDYPLDFWRGNDIGDVRFHAPVAIAFSLLNIEFL